jgi:uncharacterized CHY-type Zn-finger protein
MFQRNVVSSLSTVEKFKKIQAFRDEDTTDLTTCWGRVLSQQNRCSRYLMLRLLLDALKYMEAQKYLSSFASSHNQKESNLFYTVQAKQALLVPCTTSRYQDLSHKSEKTHWYSKHVDIPNVSRFLSPDFRWRFVAGKWWSWEWSGV